MLAVVLCLLSGGYGYLLASARSAREIERLKAQRLAARLTADEAQQALWVERGAR